MRKQYLHLSAYACARCAGPVIAGSFGIRENEISKETEITHAGAICLSCGHRQDQTTEPARAHHLAPIEWELRGATNMSPLTVAFAQTLNRSEPN